MCVDPTPREPAVESFDAFYGREFGPLTALAAAVGGDRSTAEDIAQEALSRAHKHWVKISVYERPGAWARRVTINLASSARHRKTIELRVKLRLGGDRAVQLRPAPADQRHIWEAVNSLPKNQRAAVALHYLEDRPVRDIAEILGCAESTAKVHLHRGRASLAELLKGEGQ